MKIPFAKVKCSGNELKYVAEVLESGWLTTAGKTRVFEEAFAEHVGAKYTCAVNSCTAALHLAAEALGIGPGDKVFVPTMTFTATAEIVRYLGADPVFLDVEYGTGLVTPDIVADAIVRHPDVRFLIVVHYGGQAARMISGNGRGILDICRDKGIGVIEDAAHAFPCRHAGRFVGSIGDATCFSFYANKTITTAEGGMLTTNDLGIAKRARIMRLHGIDRDIWQRFTSSAQEWEYDVIAPGFKYNMPDLNAAVGLAQLEKAEEHRRDRQRVAEMYFAGLVGIEGIDLPNCACTMEEHAWHLFPIVLNEHSRVSRNELIRKLAERGIGTSVHYKPIHRMTYYAERYRLKPEDFPVAERIWHGTLSLPIYSSLTDNEVDYVCGSLRDLLGAR